MENEYSTPVVDISQTRDEPDTVNGSEATSWYCSAYGSCGALC